MLAEPLGSAETAGDPRPDNHPGPGEDRGAAVTYAGLVTRTIAFAIDLLLIVTVALAAAGGLLLIFAVFAVKGSDHTVAVAIGGVAFVAWVIGYFVSFWVTTGQTPGSRAMRIRVVRSDASLVRPQQALVRLGSMVLSLPLFWGFWPVLTSPRRRSVPDWIAGTVVIVTDP